MQLLDSETRQLLEMQCCYAALGSQLSRYVRHHIFNHMACSCNVGRVYRAMYRSRRCETHALTLNSNSRIRKPGAPSSSKFGTADFYNERNILNELAKL